MMINKKKKENLQNSRLCCPGIGAFGTITKGLLKGLEDLEVGGRVETIQKTALLRTARILRKVLETWGTYVHSDSYEKPSANVDLKSSK